MSALLFISLCVDDEMMSSVEDLTVIIIISHAKDYELVLLPESSTGLSAERAGQNTVVMHSFFFAWWHSSCVS